MYFFFVFFFLQFFLVVTIKTGGKTYFLFLELKAINSSCCWSRKQSLHDLGGQISVFPFQATQTSIYFRLLETKKCSCLRQQAPTSILTLR